MSDAAVRAEAERQLAPVDLVLLAIFLLGLYLGVSLQLVQSGKLKLIAVGTEKRMTALPDIPTIAETLPGFASSAWFAVVGPPNLPAEIAARISADIAEGLRQPDIGRRLASLSAEPVGGTPAQTAAFMHAEVERWNKVIKAANVRLE